MMNTWHWLMTGVLMVGAGTACDDVARPDDTDDTDDDDSDPQCPAQTGAGTAHSAFITADEVWRAADGPHHVTANIDIEATLTIEPCARVLVAPGVVLSVGDTGVDGAVVAVGTAAEPITFDVESDDEAETGAFWGGFFVEPTGTLTLEHVLLERAGNVDTNEAAIQARGLDDTAVRTTVSLKNTQIKNAGGSGLLLRRNVGVTDDSHDVVITGSGEQGEPDAEDFPRGYPIDIEPPGLSTLPTGTFTGNLHDAVVVRAPPGRVEVDEHFKNLGVPYLIRHGFRMYSVAGTPLTLTIDAGVQLEFAAPSSGEIVGMALGALDAPVTLVANGTADAPIVWTSHHFDDAPTAPGDWAGLMLSGSPSTGNSIRFNTFAGAGAFTGTSGYGCGSGSNVGGVIVVDWTPGEAFITDSHFEDIAGNGIDSGWRLGPGEAGVDLTANNTFINIVDYDNGSFVEGHCAVSSYAPEAGCPLERPVCLTP